MRPPAVAVGLAATLFLLPWLAPFPEDWDGIGFVRALSSFDLREFRPHFPGYPVYVALSKVLAVLGLSHAVACSFASVLGAALTIYVFASHVSSPWTAILPLISPVFVLTSTGVGTDSLGLGLALLALHFGAQQRGVWAGLCAGLALGARPSNAVFLLAGWLCFLLGRVPRKTHLHAALVAGVVLLGSFLPLLLRYGTAFLSLGSVHVHGHFSQWGGSALTDSVGVSRLLVWGERFWSQGLGGGVSAVALCTLALLGSRNISKNTALRAAAFLLLAGSYVFFVQNVSMVRHSLALLAVVFFLAANVLRSSRFVAILTAILLVLGLSRSVSLLQQRRLQEPPGLVLARVVQQADPAGVLFGTRSVRYGELLGLQVYPRSWMGEVEVTLERLRRLPREVHLTDEVQFRNRAQGRITWIRTACRDVRFERGAACVSLYRYEPLVDSAGAGSVGGSAGGFMSVR